MRYFHLSSELKNKLDALDTAIKLSMNGINADSMTKKGIVYKKNYGLTSDQINRIATKQAKNSIFSTYLWYTQEREHMLIALKIQEIENFSLQDAKDWSKLICNTELAQQSSKSLFQYMNDAKEFAYTTIINENNEFIKSSGLYTASYITNQFSMIEKYELIKQAIIAADTPSFSFAHAISVFLRKISAGNIEMTKEILQKITKFESSKIRAQQYIYQELKLYLDFINQ